MDRSESDVNKWHNAWRGWREAVVGVGDWQTPTIGCQDNRHESRAHCGSCDHSCCTTRTVLVRRRDAVPVFDESTAYNVYKQKSNRSFDKLRSAALSFLLTRTVSTTMTRVDKHEIAKVTAIREGNFSYGLSRWSSFRRISKSSRRCHCSLCPPKPESDQKRKSERKKKKWLSWIIIVKMIAFEQTVAQPRNVWVEQPQFAVLPLLSSTFAVAPSQVCCNCCKPTEMAGGFEQAVQQSLLL